MTSDPVYWFVLVWPLIVAAFAVFCAFVVFPRFDKWVDARFPIERASADDVAKTPAE